VDVPEAAPSTIEREELPLDILYQDPDVAVLNKAAGMVVHPAAGHASGTLVNALLHHLTDLSGIGGERRPGIVHRLTAGHRA
jgi:23S rRNA pseudouridine1911/1915/1917 synthase